MIANGNWEDMTLSVRGFRHKRCQQRLSGHMGALNGAAAVFEAPSERGIRSHLYLLV